MKPGSWGSIPKELQKLPPGAKLCGSSDFVTFIASPLEGQAMHDYYAPLMAKAGCPNLTCKVHMDQTDCSCEHKNRIGKPAIGRLLTGTGLELYKLFY